MLGRRQFIAGTALALAATVSHVIGSEEAMPVYTFEDDFDGPAGTAPDLTKWTYSLGGGGHGNGDLQTYTSSLANAYLDGSSNLVIAATEVNGGYQSAQLTTLGLFSQIGGHIAARIKLNVQPGIWPAFWLLGQDMAVEGWPKCGEIDGLENFGYTNQVASSVYTPNTGLTTYKFGSSITDDGNFHTYQVDVDAEGVVFSRDGDEYGHCPSTYCPPASWVFGPQEPNNGGLYILLQVAIGGNASQNPPPPTTKFPATMLVDYVRAWA